MSSYLSGYGAGEEKRNQTIKRGILAAVALIVIGLGAYFALRNYSEKSKLSTLRELLEKKDYAAAYRHWGCTPEKPCRDYPMEKFMEDWGEKSGHTNFAAMKIVRTVTCKDGYAQSWDFGGKEDERQNLYVNRADQSLSYEPWPNWRQTWLAGLLNDCSGQKRTLPNYLPASR